MSKEEIKNNQEEEVNAQDESQEQDEVQNEQEEVKAEDTEASSEESTEEVEEKEEKNTVQDDFKDKYLRLYSDFENFRKRTAKEKLDFMKNANEDLILNLLPILDDFERAMKSMDAEDENLKPAIEGMTLIQNKLLKTLENKGLKIMEDPKGKEFDIDAHEAITQIPAPSEDMKGKIVDCVENGYTLNEKVIRYAKVVVGA